MSNNIQLFNHADFSVRAFEEDGVIWVVAKDVAEALDYSNWQPNIVSHVQESWKGIKRINTPGGEQDMLCLTEQGLYFFLGRSDKKKALPYQKWIADDVVPSIRKTGSYSMNKEQPALPSGVLDGAKLIFETAGIKDNQLTLAFDKVYKSYTGRSALQSGEVELIAPVKEQILTVTEIAKHFDFDKPKKGAQFINSLLEQAGYQLRTPNKLWEPTELGKSFAVMLDTNKKRSDGSPVRFLKWNSGIIGVIENLLHQ